MKFVLGVYIAKKKDINCPQCLIEEFSTGIDFICEKYYYGHQMCWSHDSRKIDTINVT